jgi:hypothetical protein
MWITLYGCDIPLKNLVFFVVHKNIKYKNYKNKKRKPHKTIDNIAVSLATCTIIINPNGKDIRRLRGFVLNIFIYVFIIACI